MIIGVAAVAMLACARIGAAHSVGDLRRVLVTGAMADRMQRRRGEAASSPPTAGYRRGARSSRSRTQRRRGVARTARPSLQHMVVVKRDAATSVTMVEGRDHWYHDLMEDASDDCPAEPMDAEQLLFLLYTSGTTGEAEGHHAHRRCGYLTHATYTHRYVFDLQPRRPTSSGAAADVGWVTGHSYIVYGPLSNGATSGDVRGRARHATSRGARGRSGRVEEGPPLGDHREATG